MLNQYGVDVVVDLDLDAADPLEVQDKAFELLQTANATGARVSAQLQQLARLRAEVTVLRDLAARGAAPPASAAVPSPLPAILPVEDLVIVPLPFLKEAAADSAPVAVSFRTGWALNARRAAPYAALLTLALVVQSQMKPRTAQGASSLLTPVRMPAGDLPLPYPSATDDDASGQALLLVHQWRLPGDELPLSDRLDSGVQLPGTASAWTTERTGERLYRVTFRRSEETPSYEFDVDLESNRVDPTPQTSELIAPHLTASR